MIKLRNSAIVILVLVSQLPFQNSAQALDLNWLKSFDNIYQAVQSPLMSVDRKETTPIVAGQAFIETATIISVSPKKESKSESRKHKVAATAYSSTPDQTDDSPFITAAGTYVRDGIVATNLIDPLTGRRYAFGTRIKIPDVYGDKIFVVEDRMNSRYIERIDIWFPTRQEALQFGKKTVVIEVLL